jgi:inward rectifier potassium channel
MAEPGTNPGAPLGPAPGRAPVRPGGTGPQKIKTLGVQRAPHKDAYHFVLARGWLAFCALIGLVFVTANVVFAALYAARPGCIANARPGSFEDAFYFSIQTIATIGYGGMYPATRYGHVLVAIEAMCGILGLAVITGLTYARFSRPTARVLFSKRATITPRDGVPHLMFRMANWRRNRIVEARLSVTMLVTEVTTEGETLRRQLDVPMVRERTAVFFLTWSAMHRIEPGSPFYSPEGIDRGLAELRARRAELYLSLMGFDETIGQTIHARYEYGLDDIVVGARFADVLGTDAGGGPLIDYRKFHDVVPLSAELAAVVNGKPASGLSAGAGNGAAGAGERQQRPKP